MLDNTVAARRVGELEAKDDRVVFGLLEAVAGLFVGSLCLYKCDGEITSVAQKVIGALLRATGDFAANDDDPPVREGLLLADLVVVPTRCVKLRQDVFPTGVGFG